MDSHGTPATPLIHVLEHSIALNLLLIVLFHVVSMEGALTGKDALLHQ